jgi:O-antigen/teichoic acid export membrane protein
MFENHFRRILKSDFNRNVLILSSGTAISQLILVLISPVLTRLYSPEAFGIFAIFLSITAIIGSNINLKYEQAIMLPKEEADAYKLAYLSNYLNLMFSAFLLILIAFFYKPVANILKVNDQTAYWLYLVPFATYFIGFNSVLVNLNNRMENYKAMSGSVIAKNGVMTIIQLTLGFFKLLMNSGLIIGQLVAYVFGNRVLRLNVAFSVKKMLKHKLIDFYPVMKRYIDFPRFAFPAGVANTTTLNISNLLITTVYSVNNVGYFSLANRILGAPSVLISQSIAQVYYQKASEEIRKNGNCKQIFKATLKKLLLLSFPIFLPIALLSRWLFPFVFGADWAVAGILASYLSIMFAFRFVSSTLSITLDVTEHQKYSLYINIILLATNLLVILISYLNSWEMKIFVLIYSLAMSLVYLSFLYIYHKLSLKISKSFGL